MFLERKGVFGGGGRTRARGDLRAVTAGALGGLKRASFAQALAFQRTEHLVSKTAHVDRFRDVPVEAGLKRPLPISAHGVGGERNDPHGPERRAPDLSEKRKAVFPRKLYVHQDQIGTAVLQLVQQPVASRETNHFITLQGEQRP